MINTGLEHVLADPKADSGVGFLEPATQPSFERREAVTFSELKKAVKNVTDLEMQLYENDSVNFTAKEQILQQKIESLILNCIEKKTRFKHIFYTEKGSVYFVTQEGSSLRIKKEDNKYTIQPFCHHIIFLSEEVRNRINLLRDSGWLQENIINQEIQTVECLVGAYPFEFGIEGFYPILVKEHSGVIQILGDEEGMFASGYHLGHKITEVI